MRDLTPVSFIPGINSEDSSLAAKGQYVDGNNVRWWKGQPQKVGGSTPYLSQGVIGAPRGKVTWRALDGTRLAAYGTAQGLFLIYNETVYDITPIDLDLFLVNPFAYTMGSSIVTVRMPDHGLLVGERVIFQNEMRIGGVASNPFMTGSFFIKEVVDDDHFNIELDFAVSFIDGLGYGTGTYENTAYGGGDQLTYVQIPIRPGNPVGIPGGGYGTGDYGAGGYGGDTGLFAANEEARIWTLDHWGEDLVASYYGSPIYTWEFFNGPEVHASVLPGAPDQVGAIFVSEDDRILVAIGASDLLSGVFDPKLVRWSDQEDNQDWEPREDNYAGDKRVEKGNKLVNSIETVSGRLIMTDTAAYTMRFIGQPFVYSLSFIESNCGLAATHGIAKIDDVAYWISTTGFYMFNGLINRVPCSLQEQLFGTADIVGEIAVAQMAIICAGENKRFKEIIFSYSSNEEGGVDRTVALQVEGDQAIWWRGDQARSTWIDDDQFLAFPVGTTEEGEILVQEYGLNNNGLPLSYSLTTSMINIAEGSRLMQFDRFVFDFKRIFGDHQIEFLVQDYSSDEVKVSDPFTFNSQTAQIFPRQTGRAVAFRIFSDAISTDFRMGQLRIGAFPRGQK